MRHRSRDVGGVGAVRDYSELVQPARTSVGLEPEVVPQLKAFIWRIIEGSDAVSS
jgi:hypothetical protein